MTAGLDHFSLYSLILTKRFFGLKNCALTPNPFSPRVDTDSDGQPGLLISFSAHAEKADQPWVTLEIFNAMGQRIRTLARDETVPNGAAVEFRWDGLTEAGLMARNGRYFVRIVLEDLNRKKESIHPAILIK